MTFFSEAVQAWGLLLYLLSFLLPRDPDGKALPGGFAGTAVRTIGLIAISGIPDMPTIGRGLFWALALTQFGYEAFNANHKEESAI